MDNILTLKELGLTNGEVKVYLALFELGETTVGPLSKESGITHAKVYPILSKLIEKGLVSHVIRRGRQHFAANNPESLLDFIENKSRSLEDKKEEIKRLIPSLLAKKQHKEDAQYSRVYEGFKGLRSLFHELFGTNKEDTEICVLGLNELLKEESFISFFRFYHDLRLKNKKIKLKLILNKELKDFFDQTYKKAGMFAKEDKIKFVDVAFPSGLFIFKDHVVNIVADKKVTAFDTKSKQNAERYRKFFYSIWDKK